MGSMVLFIILAVIAIGAALGMLLSRNAVHSALFLVLNFITIAVFYLVLNAPFIAMVQVTVYAGAIIVLFLFVIMLLGAEQLRGIGSVGAADRWQVGLAAVLGVALVGTFIYTLITAGGTGTELLADFDSSPVALGLRLFEGYVFPFEITGLLLLAAMIGVVILGRGRGRREREGGRDA